MGDWGTVMKPTDTLADWPKPGSHLNWSEG